MGHQDDLIDKCSGSGERRIIIALCKHGLTAARKSPSCHTQQMTMMMMTKEISRGFSFSVIVSSAQVGHTHSVVVIKVSLGIVGSNLAGPANCLLSRVVRGTTEDPPILESGPEIKFIDFRLVAIRE